MLKLTLSTCPAYFITYIPSKFISFRLVFALSLAKTCPDIQTYSECGTLCPPTCNAQNLEELQKHCHGGCISGCQCPPGTVLDGGRCLPVERCPCTHNREKYPPGASIPSKCNTWWEIFMSFISVSFNILAVAWKENSVCQGETTN